MKVIRRSFFVLCAVMTVALSALWVHSYHCFENLTWQSVSYDHLRIVEYIVQVNRGHLFGESRSDVFDQRDGMEYILNGRVDAGYPLGFSHFSTEPEEDGPLEPHVAWLRKIGIEVMPYAKYQITVRSRRPVIYEMGTAMVASIMVRVPIWQLLILSAFPVLLGIYLHFRAKRRARKRHETRRCVKCNYDLRASKGRCPECGTPI
jgi:hypothetical protein